MGIDQHLLKGTVSIMVLKLLRENDCYGYQIIRELERRSESAILLNEGALYPVLHKLESEGVILSYMEEHEGRKRKYYHLTPEGAALFERKEQDWNSFAGAINKILSGGENRAKMCI